MKGCRVRWDMTVCCRWTSGCDFESEGCSSQIYVAGLWDRVKICASGSNDGDVTMWVDRHRTIQNEGTSTCKMWINICGRTNEFEGGEWYTSKLRNQGTRTTCFKYLYCMHIVHVTIMVAFVGFIRHSRASIRQCWCIVRGELGWKKFNFSGVIDIGMEDEMWYGSPSRVFSFDQIDVRSKLR